MDGYISVLGKIQGCLRQRWNSKDDSRQSRPLLEKTTRDLFERFNLAYSDIKIDDATISVSLGLPESRILTRSAVASELRWR